MDGSELLHPVTRVVFQFIGSMPLVGLLLLMQFIDIISGILAGYVTKVLDSSISAPGMAKKTGMWLLILLVAILNKAVPGIPALQTVAGFFAIHETVSILENLARAGVPLPAGLVAALVRLRDTTGKVAPPNPFGEVAATVSTVTTVTTPATAPVPDPIVSHETIPASGVAAPGDPLAPPAVERTITEND